jgi:hypothetical protein
MQRALVFLLLGPALVVFVIWLAFRAPVAPVVATIAMLLFLLICLLSAMAGLVDGCLARAVPILVRAPLTAIAGSALAFLFLSLLGMTPSPMEVKSFAIAGALYIGLCSLLSHDWRGVKV